MARVVIIGPAYPYRGGIATYNELMAKAYQDRGDEVTIQTFKLQYPSFLFPGKTQFSDKEAPERINILRTINSVNPFNWLSVGNKISKAKPDLVIIRYWLPFMGPCLGTIARRIRKNKYSRVVGLIDNIIPHESRVGDKPFTKYFVKPIQGFLVMSKIVLDDLRTHFEKDKPVRFCFHPIFDNYGEHLSKVDAKSKLELNPDYKYMLFFGFIREYKGLDLLLEAMAKVKDEKVRLLIAGEHYGDRSIYDDIISRNNLRSRVIEYDKFISDEDVALYFCAADLVVQPYKSATQSGVTQIAYHFHKPMVVSNVGGLGEMIPDGEVGYVVEPNSPDIAEAINKFYEGSKEEEFSKNSETNKKRFSWEKLIEELDELEKEIK